jgi:hypothetical protein
MYTLKPNEAPFEVVDGPFTRQKFTHGIVYNDVPLADAHKFREIVEPVAEEKPVSKLSELSKVSKIKTVNNDKDSEQR